MLSYWEKTSFLHYDFVIVGSGITGLSTAISLHDKNPTSSILVLERGLFPSGASTKNAGFACFGSLTELCNDIDTMGRKATLQLVKLRKTGLQKLLRRLSGRSIDYQNYGGYELISQEQAGALNRLDEINAWLAPLFDGPVFQENKKLVNTFGFNERSIETVIHNPFEGQLNTGKMMRELLDMASEKGIRVITGAEVRSMEEITNEVILSVADPLSGSDISVSCAQAAICTNGFARQLVPAADVTPGRGAVLVTKPLSRLKFNGTFHMDRGYYYFRNIDDRILFGGGRHLYEKQETTTEFGVNTDIINKLEQLLSQIILPDTPFVIDQTWSGIMGFGTDKRPLVIRHSDRIVVGLRLGGMGIALGAALGEELADLML